MRPTKTYYPNGQLECEGFISDGLQVGNWIFYYENGTIFSKGQYDDKCMPIGKWIEYYENGQIKYEAISSKGNSFSLDDDYLQILNYWTEDGLPIIVNGNGKLVKYFDNGNIQHISNWINTLKTGLLQEFYDSDKLRIKGIYNDGAKDGLSQIYYDNGNLYGEYYYVKGNLTGKCVTWYLNGKLEEEGEYIDNEYFVINYWTENGQQILKDRNGKVIRKFGAIDGDIYEQYFENGKMINEVKISAIKFGEFIPNKNNKNGL